MTIFYCFRLLLKCIFVSNKSNLICINAKFELARFCPIFISFGQSFRILLQSLINFKRFLARAKLSKQWKSYQTRNISDSFGTYKKVPPKVVRVYCQWSNRNFTWLSVTESVSVTTIFKWKRFLREMNKKPNELTFDSWKMYVPLFLKCATLIRNRLWTMWAIKLFGLLTIP